MVTQLAAPTTRCKLLRFEIDDRPYVADIERIREIVFYRPAIPVPHAPAFLQGLMDLRGLALPLIDLRERLGVPADRRVPPTHILVVRLADELVSGLIVDRVCDVLEVDRDSFQGPDGSEGQAVMCQGVCRVKDELVLVIDLGAVLRTEDYAILAGVL
jgi:purine-binding chemotaxis protein CheW